MLLFCSKLFEIRSFFDGNLKIDYESRIFYIYEKTPNIFIMKMKDNLENYPLENHFKNAQMQSKDD